MAPYAGLFVLDQSWKFTVTTNGWLLSSPGVITDKLEIVCRVAKVVKRPGAITSDVVCDEGPGATLLRKESALLMEGTWTATEKGLFHGLGPMEPQALTEEDVILSASPKARKEHQTAERGGRSLVVKRREGAWCVFQRSEGGKTESEVCVAPDGVVAMIHRELWGTMPKETRIERSR